MKFTKISSGDFTIVYDVTEIEADTVAQFVDDVLREKPNGYGKFILESLHNDIIPTFTYYKGECDNVPARKHVRVNVDGSIRYEEAPLHLNQLKVVRVRAMETEYRGDVNYYITCREKRSNEGK